MKSLYTILLLLYVGCSGAHPSGEYQKFKARNGVEFDYQVYLPTNYDASKAYPAVVAFSNMTYSEEAAGDLFSRIWTNQEYRDYILILPLAPKKGRNGWINHPAHHALEEFLNQLRGDYKVKGNQFCSLGYKNGSIPALVWMHMSAKYFNAMLLASSHQWDENEVRDTQKMVKWDKKIALITGEKDAKGITQHNVLSKRLIGLDDKFFNRISKGDDESLDSFFQNDFGSLLKSVLQ